MKGLTKAMLFWSSRAENWWFIKKRNVGIPSEILEDHLYCQRGRHRRSQWLRLLTTLVMSLPKLQMQPLSGIFTRPPEHLGIKAEDIVCSGKARSWVMGQAWRDEAVKKHTCSLASVLFRFSIKVSIKMPNSTTAKNRCGEQRRVRFTPVGQLAPGSPPTCKKSGSQELKIKKT